MKKVLAKLLVVCCLLSSSMTAFAQEVNGDLSLEEGAQEVVITAEMEQKEQAKWAAFSRMRATYPSYCLLSVKRFQQETNYYCGPATVKQVIHYINGSSLTQSKYASILGTTTDGTTMTDIDDVLNDYISEEHYVYSSIGTQSEWLNKVRYSLYYQRPAVLDINTNGISSFSYSSSGHFVNVCGYSESSGRVAITDPYGEQNTAVWHSVSNLYSANNNHWRQAIIW